MADIESYLDGARDRVLAAWAAISENTSGILLFRIDSLAWKVSEPIYRFRLAKAAAAQSVAGILERYGAAPESAAKVAAELTYTLP